MQLFHFTPQSNVIAITKEGLQPMIGPRSQSANEAAAAIYCFTSRQAAENGLMNWLGDEFEDDTLYLLEIDGRALDIHVDAGLEWEARVHQPIPPQLILSCTEI